VKETINLSAGKIKLKEIKIKTFFRGFPESNLANTDKKRLQQVLLNLITNSIKFTGRRGKILVIVDYIPEEEGEVFKYSDFLK